MHAFVLSRMLRVAYVTAVALAGLLAWTHSIQTHWITQSLYRQPSGSDFSIQSTVAPMDTCSTVDRLRLTRAHSCSNEALERNES